MYRAIPLLGITGYSGSGKTTLLEKLIPELIARHIRVSVIKHSHHNMQVDKEGKDSWRMKEAGSSQVILANDERWAIMTETPKPASLDYLAQQFDRTLTDLVLLHRQEMTKPLPEIDEYVLAVATNYPLEFDRTLLDINRIPQIADFIENWLHHFHGAR